MNHLFIFCSGCASSLPLLEQFPTGNFLANEFHSGKRACHLVSGRLNKSGQPMAINSRFIATGEDDYQQLCRSFATPSCATSGTNGKVTLYGIFSESLAWIAYSGIDVFTTNTGCLKSADDLSFAHPNGIIAELYPRGNCVKCGRWVS